VSLVVEPRDGVPSLRLVVKTTASVAASLLLEGRLSAFLGSDDTILFSSCFEQFDPSNQDYRTTKAPFLLPIGYPAIGRSAFPVSASQAS
jgi:hypothetical protein